MMIHQNAKNPIRNIAQPRLYCLHGSDTTWDPSGDDNFGYSHIQGYQPRAFHSEQSQDR
jgi:hypothetical protein